MDPRTLNDNGKRPVTEEEGKGEQIQMYFIDQDLSPLREYMESFSKAEMEAFRESFGGVDTVLDVRVDKNAIRAFTRHFDPEVGCFVFTKLDLGIMLDEYHLLTNAIWAGRVAETYIPNLSKSIGKPLSLKPPLLKYCGIKPSWAEGGLRKMRGCIRVNWGKIYQNMKGQGGKIETTRQRINFLALGIYGLVLLPTFHNEVDSKIFDLVIDIDETSKKNVMPMVLAETLRSCTRIKKDRSGQFRCCTQLFTLWIHSHFTPERVVKYSHLFFKGSDHVSKFVEQGWEERDEDEWCKKLAQLEETDIVWKAPWLRSVDKYLAPPLGLCAVPLFGISGTACYSPYLTMRQLGGKQDDPHLYNMSSWNIQYNNKTEGTQAWKDMKKAWSECRLTPIDKGGCTDEYERWRREWIDGKCMPKKPGRTMFLEFTEVKRMLGKADQRNYILEASTEKLRSQIRVHEQREMVHEAEMERLRKDLNRVYEEAEQMEKDLGWAQLKLESQTDNVQYWKGKYREMQWEVKKLQAKLKDCNKDSRDLRAELVKLKAKMDEKDKELSSAKKELARYKRMLSEGEKNQVILEKGNAQLAQGLEEWKTKYEGEVVLRSMVDVLQKLRRKAQQRGRGDPSTVLKELQGLSSTIEQDSEVRGMLNKQGWLSGFMAKMKVNLEEIARGTNAELGLKAEDLEKLWYKVEECMWKLSEKE